MTRSVRALRFAGALIAILASAAARAEAPRNDVLLTVTTRTAGADLEATVQFVARPLEAALGDFADLDAIISISRAGQSTISMKFRTPRGPNAVAGELRAKTEALRARMPAGTNGPEIAVSDSRAAPVGYLILASETRDALEFGEIAERFVIQPLSAVADIAALRAHGVRKPIIAAILDRARMAAYSLTQDEVVAALRARGLSFDAIGTNAIAIFASGSESTGARGAV